MVRVFLCEQFNKLHWRENSEAFLLEAVTVLKLQTQTSGNISRQGGSLSLLRRGCFSNVIPVSQRLERGRVTNKLIICQKLQKQ